MDDDLEADPRGTLTVERLLKILAGYHKAAAVWIEVDGVWIRPTESESSTPTDLVLHVDVTGLDESE